MSLKLRLFILLIVVAVFAAGPVTVVYAQAGRSEAAGSPWTHRSWSIEDGLPQNTATALAQTADGYFWVGTYKGLARYDGYRFTVFETSDSPGLVGDRITRLLGDRQGNLWIGTEWNGLSLYRDGAFVDLTSAPDARPEAAADSGLVVPGFIRMLFEDSAGRVWVGVTGGLYRFGQTETRFVELGESSEISPRGMAEDREGRLWLTTNAGLARVEGLSLEWLDFNEPDTSLGRNVGPLVAEPSGGIWLPLDSGLLLLRGVDRRLIPAPVVSSMSLAHDRSGRLWIADARGGLKYVEDQAHVSNRGVPEQLRVPFLRDILTTDEGLIWIAAGDQGLHRLQPRLFSGHVPVESTSGLSINRVAEGPDGTVYAGSLTSGLWKIDGESGRIAAVEAGLPYNAVDLLASERNGTVWLTSAGLLYRLDADRLVEVKSGSGELRVRALTRRSHGGVWFASPGRLYYYDVDGFSDGIPFPEIGEDVTFEMEDRSGVLWLAPKSGLLCRVQDETGYTCFGDESGMPQKNIRDVVERPDGSIWFGTYGAGLCVLRDRRVDCLSEDAGLPDNTAHKILFDDFGFVWISSNRGVSRLAESEIESFFSGEVERVWPEHYSAADGMPSSECNIGGSRSKDGKLWFPTMKGVASVDPGTAFTYGVGQTVTHIESVDAEGGAVAASGRMTLPAGTDRIDIHFTGINFAAPERVRFRSRLVGYEDGWNGPHTRRSATYTNLAPAWYRFEVQSAIGSSGWGESAIVELKIEPFFWQTVWFRILIGLALAGMVVVVYRSRVNRLIERERLRKSEAEARRLAELDAAKSRFFANVSHEFRTPLTLIITPTEEVLESEILSGDQLRWGESVLENARRLLHLIDRLLDLTRLDAGKLELNPADGELVSFVRNLVQQFAPLAERRQVSLRFESSLERRLSRFDADRLQSILGNLLSNALKYTAAGGKVWVTMAETETGWVEFVVKDTGPGIAKDQIAGIFERYGRGSDGRGDETIGTGIGLTLAKELVDLHQGVMLVESEVGFGTAFIVKLPLDRTAGEVLGSPSSRPFGHGLTDVRGPGALETDRSAHSDEAESRPTILIVEDNEEVRALLTSQLGTGFRVVQASDGRSALLQARLRLPDVILTDVMMPEMDGIEFCRTVKSDPELRDIPVVILTARASDEHAVEALQAGADDYVAKPYHAATLREKIGRLVEVRRSLRDQYSAEFVIPSTGRIVDSADHVFAVQVAEVVAQRLDDSSFSVEALSAEIGLSRRQLARRVKDVFGESPSDLIQRMRLERAAELLAAGSGTVSEVAYKVGFKSASHFSTAFKDAFGHTPREHGL